MIYNYDKAMAHKKAKELLEEIKKKSPKAVKIPQGQTNEFKKPIKKNENK